MAKQFIKNRTFMTGLIITSFLAIICLISLFYTPYPPNEMVAQYRFDAPGARFLLGSDNFGRDVLSRIMVGSQTAFLIGFSSVACGLFFGVLIGAVAGFYGRFFDAALTRIVDVLMAFPTVLLALMFISVFGGGIYNTMVVLGVMTIPRFARISRAAYMQARKMEYVMAARLRGAGDSRIMFIHILPNIKSALIVNSAFSFSSSVLTEAGLSYLGLGISPPDPSWGRMLNESQPYMQQAPWYAVFTGIAIVLMVLGFNLLGDGLNEISGKAV